VTLKIKIMKQKEKLKNISADSVINRLKCRKCMVKIYFYPFCCSHDSYFSLAHSFFDCINWNIFQAWPENNKMESEVWSVEWSLEGVFSLALGLCQSLLPFQSQQWQSRYASTLNKAGQLSRCRDLIVDLQNMPSANSSTIRHAKFSVH